MSGLDGELQHPQSTIGKTGVGMNISVEGAQRPSTCFTGRSIHSMSAWRNRLSSLLGTIAVALLGYAATAAATTARGSPLLQFLARKPLLVDPRQG